LRLGQTELPWQTGVLDGADRGSPGATIVTGNQNDVGIGLGHPSRHRAHAALRDEFDTDGRFRIDLLEVMNELGEVLDRVNVVVRRRTDEGHPRLGVPQACDQFVDLAARQLTAFPGLAP